VSSQAPFFPGLRRNRNTPPQRISAWLLPMRWPPIAKILLLSLVGVSSTALLVHQYDAPRALGAFVVMGAGLLLLRRPENATLLAIMLIYTNVPALLHKFHGVPQPVAGLVLLLLLVPLGHHLVLKKERIRCDTTLLLLLLYLAVLLTSSLGAKDPPLATEQIIKFATEGLLIYWLIINTVRNIRIVKRILWSLLAVGSLLGAISLYQEISGNFEHQFGGLVQRNYEFQAIRQGLAANPDDPFLLELKEGISSGRSPRAKGPVNDANYFAQIMVVLLPIAVAVYRGGASNLARFLALASGGLIVGGVLVSYSRGALVALALLIMIATIIRWIRLKHLLIGAVMIAMLFSVAASEYLVNRVASVVNAADALESNSASSDAAIQGRTTQMLAALYAWKDHPVLGVGPGQYAPHYSIEYQQADASRKFRDIHVTRRAHSLYLEMGAEIGLVGLVVFLSTVGYLIRSLLRERRRWKTRDPSLADLATAFCFSLLAFLFAGVFLSFAYERYYWLLLALSSAALQSIRSHPTIFGAEPSYYCDVRSGTNGHDGSSYGTSRYALIR